MSDMYEIWLCPLQDWWKTVRKMLVFMYTGQMENFILQPVRGGLRRDWDGFLWAVPKKSTSHSKKRMYMTHKYLKPIQNYTTCPKCQNSYVLCDHCLRLLERLLLMRQEEQGKYNQ